MCKLQYNQIPIDEKGNDEFTYGGKCDGKEHILGICDGMEIIQKEKKEKMESFWSSDLMIKS